MRRSFTLENLKVNVLDRYYADKVMSFFRVNSKEITQLARLFRRIYDAGVVEYARNDDEAWQDDGRGAVVSGLWRERNCYMEILHTLACDISGNRSDLERELLRRYEGDRYYTQHTARALAPFFCNVRHNVEYEATVSQRAHQAELARHHMELSRQNRANLSQEISSGDCLSRLCRLPGRHRYERQFNSIAMRLSTIIRLLNVSEEVCPISTEAIVNRAELDTCHHVFEKNEIVSWHNSRVDQGHAATCPCCREPFSLDQIKDRPKSLGQMLTELEAFAMRPVSASVVNNNHNNDIPLALMKGL